MKSAFSLCLAGLGTTLMAAPASAELPEPVKAMLDAAIATKDEAKIKTVAEIARQTNPDDKAEIDAMLTQFKAAEAERNAVVAKLEEREIRQAGLFDRWSGEGQLGASHSTGNNDNLGVNAALKLKRDGIDWSHRLRGTVDFQRNNGSTRREQFLLAYEPRYQMSKRLFTYGLAQYERDRIQGFSGRYSLSGGLGYAVIDTNSVDLSIKAGPALRRTEFVGDGHEYRVGALLGMDFDWQIIKGLKLTQDANFVTEGGGSATVIVDSSNTTINLLTGLQAQVSDRVSTRFSYQVEYDSNPPDGGVSTDTTSRFSLVYGF